MNYLKLYLTESRFDQHYGSDPRFEVLHRFVNGAIVRDTHYNEYWDVDFTSYDL